MTVKVVITGGAGFIGSNLAEELVKRGDKVTIYDDLSSGKMENITSLLHNNDVRFIRGTVTDLPLLLDTFRGVDFIFHMAAIPSVPRSVAEPELTHSVNATGTLNVLLAARDSGVKKVVYSSSSAVYGDTEVLPVSEDVLPGPLSPYAVTKLAGEYYCDVFHQVYKLPAISLRYFNVYGPRQDPESQYAAVIPGFIRRSCRGEPAVIFGDGEQTRDFAFVKDVVRANILAAQSNACGVFNISRGERITIKRLAELIMELAGSRVKPVYQEPRVGDIKHSYADISRAKTIGYQPQYSLESGLAETIKWFREKWAEKGG